MGNYNIPRRERDVLEFAGARCEKGWLVGCLLNQLTTLYRTFLRNNDGPQHLLRHLRLPFAMNTIPAVAE